MDLDKDIEEVLERLWTLREQGIVVPPDLGEHTFDFDPGAALCEAERRGWVARCPDRIELPADGDQRAGGVIRRHRLAERLLFDVIHVDSASMEAGACEL